MSAGNADTKNAEWFQVSDEEGRVAVLRPIATIVDSGKVYSLMGAIRVNEAGDSEGGLVLVRQNSLLNEEGTRYEVVGDDAEIEKVMGHVLSALLTEYENDEFYTAPLKESGECGVSHGPLEFCYCDSDEYLQ